MPQRSLWPVIQEQEGKFAAHFNGRIVCGAFPSHPFPLTVLVIHSRTMAVGLLHSGPLIAFHLPYS
jgi:hypothetical protein